MYRERKSRTPAKTVTHFLKAVDEYGNTPAQRAELDWLLYNKPLEYAQLVLGGKIGHDFSLGCDHGRLEDQRHNKHSPALVTKDPKRGCALMKEK